MDTIANRTMANVRVSRILVATFVRPAQRVTMVCPSVKRANAMSWDR